MKKFSFLLIGILLVGTSLATPLPIDLQSGKIDPTPTIPPIGKGPLVAPSVVIDGYVLSFQYSHPAYTIYILEDDVVVYSVDVDATTTSVVLPSWLSGQYEIQLYPDGSSYYFYGIIQL